MIGEKFGRLTVIQEALKKNDGHKRYLCQCECGVKAIVTGSKLRSGNTKSCGCLRDEGGPKGKRTKPVPTDGIPW